MSSLYLWPDNPALSIFVLWLVSVVFLWAAREPMLQLMRGLGKNAESGLRAVAQWCGSTAKQLAQRSREPLVADSRLELERTLSRELLRVDAGFSEKLGQYSTLHRRLDELILQLDADYQQCGDAPPALPNWTPAVEAVAGIPTSGDPNVQKILEGIRKSMRDAEKKALRGYRTDTARRHDILGRMRSEWRDVKGLMTRVQDCVAKALQSASKIDAYVDASQKVDKEKDAASRMLTISAMKPFLISLIVMGVALGGAFINFQLIALPMSELVPAGARLGGIPVSTVSALVIVLMEIAVGIFVMDMLGITELFPKLSALPPSRRKLILSISIAGLFFLAAVESSLAVLREQIVAADAALKMALAGEGDSVLGNASNSKIPVIGQAVLGFVLPWVLAMVAIPLEMLIDSSRHVLTTLIVFLLHAIGLLSQILGRIFGHISGALNSVYDVYIAVPLRVERIFGGRGGAISGKRNRSKTKGVTDEVPI